ncbi:MAG: hypothetical protein ACK5MR_03855 [Cumulibacter sp.]
MTNPSQPQWGQPTSGQSPYGAQPTGQYIHGQNPPGQYAQSPYGQPMYGQPGPIQPGYGGFDTARTGRANPVAGILLLVGALIAALACLIPDSSGNVPLVWSIELLPDVIDYLDGPDGWELLFDALWPVIIALGALICLLAGFGMFPAGTHRGAAVTGLLGALLMLAAALILVINSGGHVFEHLNFWSTMTLIAWIPALIGAFVGFRK